MIRDFQEHIVNHNNQRVIFSGCFGSGKTTFLNDFFTNSEFNDMYYVCRLFPVNYVTSSNKDIYELMKFDLLVQLLGSGITFDRTDFDKCMSIGKSMKKNLLALIQSIVKSFSLINEEAKVLEKALEVVVNIYEGYKDDDQQSKINMFLVGLEEQTGTCYELNDISLLIREMVVKVGGLAGECVEKRKTVLLIDDFDRLEPMQSFRLLNMLSANDNETNTGKNKFGFDKIIIVCDINNLRDCFKHINGTPSAFNGYIDKFYSTHVFSFDITNEITSYIERWLPLLNIKNEDASRFIQNYMNIFKSMAQFGIINIRSLTKISNQTLVMPMKRLGDYELKSDLFEFYIKILKNLFVDDTEVVEAIQKSLRFIPLVSYEDNLGVVSDVLSVLHPSKKNDDKITEIIDDISYNFTVRTNGYNMYHIALTHVDGSPLVYSKTKIPIFNFMLKAVSRYINV